MSKTWTEYINEWSTHLTAGGRAPGTIKLRVAHITNVSIALGVVTPIDVDSPALERFIARDDWSPATKRSYRSTITTFFRWLHARGYVEADPSASLPTVLQPRQLPRPAPESATHTALRVLDDRTRLMVALMALCGLRRAEVAALHTSALMDSIHGPVLRIIGKGGHARMVPVPGWIAADLKARRGWVFPGQIDGHLSPRRVGELVRDALPGDLTAHTLRHRYGTIAYGRSRDIRAVQELMGHAKLETTAAYVAVDAEERLRAAESAWTCTG